MWIPAVAAWALAWNRWCPGPSRSIDLLAVVLALAATAGVVLNSAQPACPAASDSRLLRFRRDRRAHCPRRLDAGSGARHVGVDCGRAIRRGAARSDRRAGHL